MQKKSKSKVPSIVHHKVRNADVVFLRGADGKRRQVYLGPHGSDQARQRYHEVIAAHYAGEEPEPTKRRDRQQQPPSAYPTVSVARALTPIGQGPRPSGLIQFFDQRPANRPTSSARRTSCSTSSRGIHEPAIARLRFRRTCRKSKGSRTGTHGPTHS